VLEACGQDGARLRSGPLFTEVPGTTSRVSTSTEGLDPVGRRGRGAGFKGGEEEVDRHRQDDLREHVMFRQDVLDRHLRPLG
jgi:hypothetical protein